MTLATRCPRCGTAFRVVQDQLRVSQGWVRCGRCSTPFNAIEAMVDAERAAVEEPVTPEPEPEFEATRSWAEVDDPADAPAHGEAAPAPADDLLADELAAIELITSDGAMSAAAARPAAETRQDPVFGFDAAGDRPVEADDGPAPEGPSETEPDASLGSSTVLAASGPSDRSEGPAPAVASWSTDAPAQPEPDEPTAAPPTTTTGPTVFDRPTADFAPGETSPAPDEALANVAPQRTAAPSFVVQAERAARWRRPGVRLALSLVALLAAAGLGLQAAYVYRDRLAASDPAWRNALRTACASLGCQVGDYRQIDALSVESSALVRVERAPYYRLSVTLRNRSTLEVAAPAIDLSVSDSQGRPIARRVLTMAALGLPLRSLKPGSELPIQVPLAVAERPVSGYSVEIFYP